MHVCSPVSEKHVCYLKGVKISSRALVPTDVVRLKKDVWFCKLDSEQADLVEQFTAISQ